MYSQQKLSNYEKAMFHKKATRTNMNRRRSFG